MAFCCTIDEVVDCKTVMKENSAISTVAIGYDAELRRDYSLIVGFEVVPGEIEYYFHIISACTETGQTHTYWSGKDIGRFIDRKHRKIILRVLLSITESIVNQFKPDKFFVCTIEDNLPDKALEKHERVMEVFIACGYAVAMADPYHGKRIWIVERRVESEVASIQAEA